MKDKTYFQNCNTKEIPDTGSIVGKITVSGGTNLIELGQFHGSRGMKAEYTHFGQYMKAYREAQGRRQQKLTSK